MDNPVVRQEKCDEDVEVLWEGEWRWGVLRAWRLHADGSWTAAVMFSAPDGTRLAAFGAGEVRPAVDVSTHDEE